MEETGTCLHEGFMLVREREMINNENIISGNEVVRSNWILGIFKGGNERVMNEFNVKRMRKVKIFPSLESRSSVKGNEI